MVQAMTPKDLIKNATKLDAKVMESRHHIGSSLTANKKTVSIETKKRSAKPGAKKWDRQ